MPTLRDLHEQIAAAGIPITGVNRGTLADPVLVTVQFAPEATAEQRSQAQAIVAGFDWRPRRKRPYTELISAIGNLTVSDRNKLINLSLAHFLRENPKAASLVGITLSGDEPEP